MTKPNEKQEKPLSPAIQLKALELRQMILLAKIQKLQWEFTQDGPPNVSDKLQALQELLDEYCFSAQQMRALIIQCGGTPNNTSC